MSFGEKLKNVFKFKPKPTHVKITDLKKMENSRPENFMIVRLLHMFKHNSEIYKFVVIDKSRQVTDIISLEDDGEEMLRVLKLSWCYKIKAPSKEEQDPENFTQRKGRDIFYIISNMDYMERLDGEFEDIPRFLNYSFVSFLELNFFHVQLDKEKVMFIDLLALIDEVWEPVKLEEFEVKAQKIRLRNDVGKKICIFLLGDELIGKIENLNEIFAIKDVKVYSGYIAKSNGLPKYFANHEYTVFTKIENQKQIPPEYVQDYKKLFRIINKSVQLDELQSY